MDAERHLVPSALGLARRQGDVSPAMGPPSPPRASSWWLPDLARELRTMVRMFLDRGYRVTWTARLVPAIALILFVLSWILVGGIPLVGPLLDRAVDIVLAIVTYSALSREASRYRYILLHPHDSTWR